MIDGIGILLNDKAYKTLIRVEMVSERIIIAYFYGNPMTTITRLLLDLPVIVQQILVR